MTTYQFPYGKTNLSLELPDHYHADWIEPAYIPPAPDPIQVVADAIANPVDGIQLDRYSTARSVAIAINDKTRPVPHKHLLPPLLDALHKIGIPEQAITFYIATGTHLPMPADEFERILPAEIASKYKVVSHNCDDLDNLVLKGTTSHGTRVWVNRGFYQADLKIVVGNIEPHHFAGFSGGYKTAAIGLVGRETINPNHAMLVDPNSRIAEFAQNPLRQDIEEVGDAINVQFALNAILNSEKKIVRAVCGHPRAVMKAGIPISQEICQIKIGPGAIGTGEKYDVVIASVGGAPKDINFYQSQKALTHASLFTRDGGVIILAAECPEGSGSKAYEDFMNGVTSVDEVFSKFRTVGFRVGPHKAFQVARDLARVRIILVSKIPAEKVRELLMVPASTLQEALVLAQGLLGVDENMPLRAALLPRATNTVPVFETQA